MTKESQYVEYGFMSVAVQINTATNTIGHLDCKICTLYFSPDIQKNYLFTYSVKCPWQGSAEQYEVL